MKLTVLQLGWEFPPNSHGGLGVACEGLVRGLVSNDVHVIMILPHDPGQNIKNCTILSTDHEPLLQTQGIPSLLLPYMSSKEYTKRYRAWKKSPGPVLYGENIFAEVDRYTLITNLLLQDLEFDIIHAHDWMAYKAGILAKQLTGKPLVVHIHATEFDRSGGNNVHQAVYDIERAGLHAADKIIAVSEYTKNKIVDHYGVDSHKVEVVHNAVTKGNTQHKFNKNSKMVLFLGRLTLQKGPDYFIKAAKKVVEFRPNVQFVIAGSGDMQEHLIKEVATSNLSEKILFTGQLSREEVDRVYQMADVFVMPSVSEPFGMTALEAMANGTPVIVSKQAGVCEVVGHCLKVDFWDINELVNRIISVLDHDELQNEMVINASTEVKRFNWHDVAKKCIDIYQTCLGY